MSHQIRLSNFDLQFVYKLDSLSSSMLLARRDEDVWPVNFGGPA